MSNSQSVTFTSTCGGSVTATLNIVPDPITGNNYTNVSQLCSQDSLQSTCFNGNLPGMQGYMYQAIVVLSPPCDTWTMGWSTCCRNGTVNVPTSSGDNVYLEATMNSMTNNCNNSPVFNAQPIPYVCINQPVSYNYGVTEPDGDSLVYSLVPGMESTTLNLVYGGGASGAVPIAGIAIDPNTGQLTFTPTQLGNFIVVVQVDEYDSNGNLLGTVMRDIQFVVQNCTNQVPSGSPTIGNVSGNGNQIGPLEVELCEGANICFDVTFDDPDLNDTLTFTSNVMTVLPGATITSTGANPLVISVCWTAQPNSPSFTSFNVDVDDGACPVAGITTTTIGVNIITSTYVGPDQTICGTQTAPLSASGGSIFTWTVLSGDPITPGNFSCNPCANPVAQPSVTTTYMVTSDLTGTCVNTDTVTINVVPDFTWNLTQSSPSSCLLEPVDLNLVPTPGGNYTYDWSPPGPLSNPNISNPTASLITPGFNTFVVTMTSPLGCVLTDSLDIYVAGNYAPDVSISLSDTTPACGDSVILDAIFAPQIPTTNGLATSPAPGPPINVTLGNGTATNTTTSYPAPFGNFYNGVRHQFLFRASELNAMGFNGGQFKEIAFDVAAIAGLTNYSNFEVRMGVTNNTQLSAWETGTVVVRPAAPHNVTVGWNTLTFGTGFNWDGISNVVVEVCFDQFGISTWTNNCQTRYTPTPFNSTLYFNSDVGGVCYGGTGIQSPNRPNIRFTYCDVAANPGSYTYEWSPGITLTDSTIQTPTAFTYLTQNYTLIVTDTAGGCTDTASMALVMNCACQDPIPEMTPPTCNGGSDGMIVATPIIGINPLIIEFYDDQGTLLQQSPAQSIADTLFNIPAGVYTIQVVDTALVCMGDTVITVTEPTPVTVDAVSDTIICENGTATLTAIPDGGNGAPYTLTWNSGLMGNGPHDVMPTVASCYNVFAEDSLGCLSQLDSTCVDILPPIVVTTSGDDFICPDGSITLTGSATGGSGSAFNFEWQDSQGNVLANDAVVTVTPTAGTSVYCVTVTDDCETTPVTECVTITWHPLPNVDFISNSAGGCYPQDIEFTNLTPANEVSSVVWDFTYNGVTSTDPLNPSVIFETPGCYDVRLTVTSPEGCVNDSIIEDMICIYGYPIADFTFGPQPTTILNTNIDFLNASSGDATTFNWNFNNGEGFSDLEDPRFFFPNDGLGEYNVTLLVANQWGCIDSVTYVVVIDGEHLLYVPNSFTPNGDGLNDIFMPMGEGFDLSQFEMFIFDRWGNRIFYSENAGEGWDGTLNGSQQAPIGAYVWKIRSVNKYNEDLHENVGHVTIVR